MKPNQETVYYIPHEVVSRLVLGDATPIRAWREYLGLTQEAVAAKLNISVAAYARKELGVRLRNSTLEKIATVFGIHIKQLKI